MRSDGLAELNFDSVCSVDNAQISELLERMKLSEVGHSRICLHHNQESAIQEMIIAVDKRAIFPPHRHPLGKSESIHIIEGELRTLVFNDLGSIERILTLSSNNIRTKNGHMLQRIEGGVWHLPICVTEIAIYHEIYVGPYAKMTDVQIPEWAPEPTDRCALGAYYQSLREKYDL